MDSVRAGKIYVLAVLMEEMVSSRKRYYNKRFSHPAKRSSGMMVDKWIVLALITVC